MCVGVSIIYCNHTKGSLLIVCNDYLMLAIDVDFIVVTCCLKLLFSLFLTLTHHSHRVISGPLFNQSWVSLDDEIRALEQKQAFMQGLLQE